VVIRARIRWRQSSADERAYLLFLIGFEYLPDRIEVGQVSCESGKAGEAAGRHAMLAQKISSYSAVLRLDERGTYSIQDLGNGL
jgi:hypothetical protein